MTWSHALLGFFITIDAQNNPLMALAAAATAAGLLWFVVVQARHREERKAEAKRDPRERPPRTW
jgi:hypothetical protein